MWNYLSEEKSKSMKSQYTELHLLVDENIKTSNGQKA